MIADDLVALSAVALARAIHDREASALEVVEAHLARIAAVNEAINAVVALAEEAALARARKADAALARGEPWGPLHGVPFTAKDVLAAAGLPHAIGIPERAGVIADADATVVARVRGAGGILLGKTNCPPWGGGMETVNDLHGRTSNPYDVTRTCAGSSGGEAAIVAAGGSPCGLGTDSGGSIRVPAHFCGLAALKPTAGLVPVTGVIDDLGQIGALSDPRTQVGPLARSVADVALLLLVIAGPDGRDGGVAPVAPADPGAVDVAGLRVAVAYGAGDGMEPTQDTVATVEAAAGALRPLARASSTPSRPRAGRRSRSRSGAPTATPWAPRSSTACCAGGTRSAPRCSRSASASTRSSARCSRAPRARTA